MKIKPIKVDLQQQDWKTLLNTPLTDRGQYQSDEETLIYTQVTGRFLGCPVDEEEYLESLYKLIFQSENTIHLLSKELDKSIENDKFQAIQKIMTIHTKEKGLSVNRFVAFMEGERLLPLRDMGDFYRHYRGMTIKLIALFEEKNQTLLHPDFRRIIVDTVKWSWNHIDKWVRDINLTLEVPKIVWYGNASKSEAYFLYFLIMLGFDVLIFHPEGIDVLAEIDNEAAPLVTYPSTMPLVPFPETKPIRKSTVAKKASKEMESVLHSEDSLLYRPWQFRSYMPQSVTLKTTYDEIFLIMREKAFIRPNFEAKSNRVYIPSLFSKVLGISLNKKEYWGRIHELVDKDLSVVLTSFPFSNAVKGNQRYHYQEGLTNGILDPKKMIKGNWWKYKQLQEDLQLGLAAAISRYVDKANLQALEHESAEQVKLYLFTQAMDIPEEVLHLFQQFDYSQAVPKVLIFNDGNSGELTRNDGALLLLLNELGFDLFIYNPTGQNDIELFIDSNLFDAHWLEEVSFDETFHKQGLKKGSIIKKLLNKFLS